MSTEKMVPVTLTMDPERHRKLKAASTSTRISMSELVRLSIDNLMTEIGDPERPDAEALAALLSKARRADEAAADIDGRPTPRG